jgi:hypothetical protein
MRIVFVDEQGKIIHDKTVGMLLPEPFVLLPAPSGGEARL